MNRPRASDGWAWGVIGGLTLLGAIACLFLHRPGTLTPVQPHTGQAIDQALPALWQAVYAPDASQARVWVEAAQSQGLAGHGAITVEPLPVGHRVVLTHIDAWLCARLRSSPDVPLASQPPVEWSYQNHPIARSTLPCPKDSSEVLQGTMSLRVIASQESHP